MDRVCENCKYQIFAYDENDFEYPDCSLGAFTACACAGAVDYFEPKNDHPKLLGGVKGEVENENDM